MGVCFAFAGLVLLGVPSVEAQWYGRLSGSLAAAAAGQFTTPVNGPRRESDGTLLRESSTNSPGVLFSFRAYPVARSGIELNYHESKFQQVTFDPATGVAASVLPMRMHEMTGAYLLRLHIKRFEPYVGLGGGMTEFTAKAGPRGSSRQWRETALAELTWNRQINARFGFRVGVREMVYRAPELGGAAVNARGALSTTEPFGGVYFKLPTLE